MERKYYRRGEGEELGKFGAESSGSFNSYDNEEEESEEQWVARMAVEANPFADCPENYPWGP
jgi:hypothetical protein